jgi:predicted ATPase/DNA-binding CsgD family transcriptional regulator/transcriptional regulator with XRE-family HTH domain
MVSELPADCSQHVKQLRTRFGLTQTRLAALLGVSIASVNRWEQGQTRPSPLAWQLISRVEVEGIGVPAESQDSAAGAGYGLELASSRPAADAPAALDFHLPIALTSFVGREREVAEVRRLLGATRLLTLTGAAGCGKTRLAIEVAGGLRQSYADGVRLIELAELSDPALVSHAVAVAVGVRERPGHRLLDDLIAFLAARQMLLVLDNCEHLVAACAALAEDLLSGCPHLRILATTREAFAIVGETALLVPPLSLPGPEHSQSAEALLGSEAVRLFVERACAVQPAFALTGENSTAVAEICLRLDGLPLALELAAGRARVLTAEQIAARLSDRFMLLARGSRTAVPRHQSLRAAVRWSYDLLEQAERGLFERLAVFAGGFTVEAATAIGTDGDRGEQDVLALLEQLVERSLVVVEIRDGQARYRLLETLRQYAEEQLAACEAPDAVRKRHANWFVRFAETADVQLRGPDTTIWLVRIEVERDNLRAALRWSATHREPELAFRLGGALWYFWYLRGYATEGRAELLALRALLPVPGQDVPLAKVLIGAAYLARQQADHDAGRALAEEALRIFRAAGDRPGIAFAAQTIGFEARVQEDYATARPLLEESLVLFRELGDEFRTATSLHHLGFIAADGERDYGAARLLQEESRALYQRVGSRRQIALVLLALGEIARAERDATQAGALLGEGLDLLAELGDEWSISLALDHLAALAADDGRFEQAERIAAAAAGVHDRLGTMPWLVVQRERDRWRGAAQQVLSEEAAALAWAAGLALPLQQAIAEALSVAVSEPDPPAAPGSHLVTGVAQPGTTINPNELTGREVEVLCLLARGHTNQQIAEALVVSVRTAENHIASIYGKIGAHGRADASVYALRQGLI